MDLNGDVSFVKDQVSHAHKRKDRHADHAQFTGIRDGQVEIPLENLLNNGDKNQDKRDHNKEKLDLCENLFKFQIM
mgnify:CR=1 FL=1